MITALCGLGCGAGLLLVLGAVRPRRPALADALAAPDRQPTAPTVGTGAAAGWATRVSRPLARRLTGLPLVPGRTRRDLTTLDRPLEGHLAQKVTAAVAGFLLAPALFVVLAAGGVLLPVPVPVWAALALACGGFIVPDLGLHDDAERARRQFRHAFSSVLDLTVIGLAGGAGLEQALTDAADAGDGPAFTDLRRALDEARLSRQPPWEALARLGRRIGLPELEETAASVALAGGEGAKIRASLGAKAAALRTHQLTDAEADAAATTERMSLPVVVLLAGFLLFIGYPAIQHVLSGL